MSIDANPSFESFEERPNPDSIMPPVAGSTPSSEFPGITVDARPEAGNSSTRARQLFIAAGSVPVAAVVMGTIGQEVIDTARRAIGW